MKKEYQNFIFLTILFIFLFFIYFYFLFFPTNKKIKKIQEEILLKTKQIKYAEGLKEKLPILKSEIKLLEEEAKQLEEKLPSDIGLPQLIRIISKESYNYNIKITKLAKQDVISFNNFDEIPISLNFRSNYHNLAQFLVSLAQNRRIFAVYQLTLKYQPTLEKQENNLECVGVIHSYSSK